MEFEFELAQPDDDPALRQLLANSAMPGRITVTFEREPNYFLGCSTMGHEWQIVIARHKPSGEIAGVLCRAISPRFINGLEQQLGYIGQIRITEKYRGLWILQRGLEFFRSLHADGKVRAYWGVISSENAIARGILVERRRKSFPTARLIAPIFTAGIIVRKPGPDLPFSGQIERGSLACLAEIVAFLRRQGAARQFFPVYSETDFTTNAGTRGFDLYDFFIARKEGAIQGVIGLWDQSSYKQTIVRGYDRSLKLIQPFYDLGARLLGAQPLPRQGEHLNSVYASFICIANDDQAIFRSLLRKVYNTAAERGYAHLMIGLSEYDPLLSVVRAYPHIAYHSQLFIGYWADAGDFYQELDLRIPYIEIAAL